MYQVILEKSVGKLLQKIASPDFKKLKAALIRLRVDPRSHGYLKLKGRGGYRVRVGDYRIIYEIKDDQLIVLVITIAHRKDVYE